MADTKGVCMYISLLCLFERVCIYIYMCVCMYLCICVCELIGTYNFASSGISALDDAMGDTKGVCVYCMCICMYACVCIYIYIYIRVSMHTCTHTDICIHTHTRTQQTGIKTCPSECLKKGKGAGGAGGAGGGDFKGSS
jgi:hypothetical protein